MRFANEMGFRFLGLGRELKKVGFVRNGGVVEEAHAGADAVVVSCFVADFFG